MLGQAHGAGDINAGRAAHAQALVAQQVEDVGQGFLVADGECCIDLGLGDIIGHVVDPNALDNGAARAGLQLAVAEILVE